MARILVVDDKEQNRYMQKVLLEGHGHEVTTASSGVEALELGKTLEPRLVITDVLMPDMDGFTLCRQWQADEQLRAIPLIFYTATYTDAQDEEFGLQLGAARFVRKPTEPEDIVRIVADVLTSWSHDDAPRSVPQADDELLKQYNAALVRKLDTKIAQLEESRNRLWMAQASLDQSAILILWVDEGGAISYANNAARAALATRGADLAGQPISRCEPRWDAECWQRVWESLRERGAEHMQTRFRSLEGDEFPVELTATYFQHAGSAHVAVFAADVTARKNLEKGLRQAQRMEAMGRLAGSVAHDFNNLLTALFGNIEIARRHAASDSAVCADLGEMEEIAQRASTLTKQLLAFGREQVLQPSRLHLNTVVRDFEPLLRHAIGAASAISVQLDASNDVIVADRGQLEQVLMNLALNARDSMRDEGVVTIGTEDQGHEVKLTVTDTGEGMEPEVIERMFEPFFTTKESGKGTGLGLASVYGIVEQSGGRIEVDSTLGEGTTIAVYLPVAE